MKLLSFGDLHLGAGTALGRAPGDRLRDQADVLERILGLACKKEAEAILVAGDILNGPTVTPEQLDVFAHFVASAHEDGIPVVAISGNSTHDLAMREVNGLAIFDRLPGITVYSRPALHDLGEISVTCMPWVSPARLVASMDGDVDRDRVNARAAELLVKVAAGLMDPLKPTVLLMHGSLSGASLPTGISTDDLREPVIPVEELLDLGYAAIVAAHIHVPQIYTETPSATFWSQPPSIDYYDHPVVLYTGSPMPLNFGETNVRHGVWILDVDEKGTCAEFVPINSRPLQHTIFDIAGVPVDEFLDSICEPSAWPGVDEAIVKVSVRCTAAQQRRLDLARLREAVLAAGAHTVKIDVETVREQRSRVESVTGELSPLDAFDAWASANPIDPELATALRDQFQADLETVGA